MMAVAVGAAGADCVGVGCRRKVRRLYRRSPAIRRSRSPPIITAIVRRRYSSSRPTGSSATSRSSRAEGAHSDGVSLSRAQGRYARGAGAASSSTTSGARRFWRRSAGLRPTDKLREGQDLLIPFQHVHRTEVPESLQSVARAFYGDRVEGEAARGLQLPQRRRCWPRARSIAGADRARARSRGAPAAGRREADRRQQGQSSAAGADAGRGAAERGAEARGGAGREGRQAARRSPRRRTRTAATRTCRRCSTRC